MQADSRTLLSLFEPFQRPDAFPREAIHPFATASSTTCGLLQDLINVTEQASHSLQLYDTSNQWSNPKLTSLLRQHTSIEHTSHSSAKNVQHLINTLSKRPNVLYGENIPFLVASFPQWCIDQLVTWGKSVGMETFKDESRPGASTVVLAGKVLVIDVDFTIRQDDPLNPTLEVANVKTSNALLPGNTNPSTFTMLDTFLAENISKYCMEMQKSETVRNPLLAATFRKAVLDDLLYLVLLDRLANRKDGGVRWFTDIDELCPTLMAVAMSEAETIASSLSMAKTPLDIFLLRSHSLPLPYLTLPSISFLTYLSPSAYLSLVRKSSNNDYNEDLPLDLAYSDIRSNLDTLSTGVTLASLYLDKLSDAHLYPQSMSMPTIRARPSFPLCSTSVELDHLFPQLDVYTDMESQDINQLEASGPYAWVLDFTGQGKRAGVVMSQSRMKAIELVVSPLGGDNLVNVPNMLSFGTGSWVDLLLNPGTTVSPERYTALYRSPNFLHPPLQLRLTAPEEPGFILERIPVRSVKEVWGILEVVREQCWLNEILLECHWTTEGLKAEEEDVEDETSATEGDLEAILAGMNVPRKIPVNVFLPSGGPTDNIFGSSEFDFLSISRPKILMTSPQRSQISGLVEIAVTHDESKPRGILVEVQGAMGFDLKNGDLEEVCRRGGASPVISNLMLHLELGLDNLSDFDAPDTLRARPRTVGVPARAYFNGLAPSFITSFILVDLVEI